MCTAQFQQGITKMGLSGPGGKFPGAGEPPATPRSASDVPLGSGLADAASISLMDRRKQLEDALNESQ